MENLQEVKVQTKEWANPTPAGLVALAVACFCFFGQLTGLVNTPECMPLLGCWLIGGFVVQLLVGLIDLKGGNGTGGNTFMFFSAFFMLVGGLEMFFKYNSTMAQKLLEPGVEVNLLLDSRIDGYAWIALTIALILWTPAFLKTFSLLSLVVLAIDVALPFKTMLNLKLLTGDFKVIAENIAGYALLAAGLFGLYLGAAIIVNTAFGKEIYPIIKPKKK